MSSKVIRLLFVALSAASIFAGCASSQMKARAQQRDKLAQTSGAYCEFVNGEVYHDIDVQMNIEMAKRCDMDKSFSITSYRTPSENQGVIYCCAMSEKKPQASIKAEEEPKAESKAEKK